MSSIIYQTETGRAAAEYAREIELECREIIAAGQELDEEHPDLIKVIADTEGTLRLVIGPGGSRIDLVLAEGHQWFEVRCEGAVYVFEAGLDDDYVAAFRASRWREAMEDALHR